MCETTSILKETGKYKFLIQVKATEALLNQNENKDCCSEWRTLKGIAYDDLFRLHFSLGWTDRDQTTPTGAFSYMANKRPRSWHRT